MTTRRPIGTANLALAAVLVAGAGCFIDPVNRAPSVVSISPIGAIRKNQNATLKITAYDPDSDSLTVTWAVQSGGCPSDKTDPGKWPAARHDVMPLDEGVAVVVDKTLTIGRFCVWGFATDRYGATAVYNLPFDPANQPPQAKIDVLAPSTGDPFPLYSQFVLTSDNSSDPERDELTFDWKLTNKPPGSTADSVSCILPRGVTARDVYCFTADRSGQYEVVMTASEAASDGNTPTLSTPVTRVFNVNPDRLPCILATMPMYSDGEIPVLGDAGDAMRFEVDMVDDDGDGYPATTPNALSFSWFLTGPDGQLQTLENDFPSLTVGLRNYHIGDLVKVRLEVHDRNREAGNLSLLGCGDADLCSDLKNGCFQRVTWKLRWSAGP